MPNKDIQKDVKKLSTQPNNNNQNSDSNSVVYLRLHGGREVASFRIKPELKMAFKRFCEENGLSMCHIIEGLISAFLYGVGKGFELVNQSPTINLTLVRDVKRVRRYAVEEVDEFNGGVYCVLKQRLFRFDELRFLPCWFWKDCRCGNVHCWERIKPLIMQLRGSVNE